MPKEGKKKKKLGLTASKSEVWSFQVCYYLSYLRSPPLNCRFKTLYKSFSLSLWAYGKAINVPNIKLLNNMNNSQSDKNLYSKCKLGTQTEADQPMLW